MFKVTFDMQYQLIVKFCSFVIVLTLNMNIFYLCYVSVQGLHVGK